MLYTYRKCRSSLRTVPSIARRNPARRFASIYLRCHQNHLSQIAAKAITETMATIHRTIFNKRPVSRRFFIRVFFSLYVTKICRPLCSRIGTPPLSFHPPLHYFRHRIAHRLAMTTEIWRRWCHKARIVVVMTPQQRCQSHRLQPNSTPQLPPAPPTTLAKVVTATTRRTLLAMAIVML